jgi:hypothetical protein
VNSLRMKYIGRAAVKLENHNCETHRPAGQQLTTFLFQPSERLVVPPLREIVLLTFNVDSPRYNESIGSPMLTLEIVASDDTMTGVRLLYVLSPVSYCLYSIRRVRLVAKVFDIRRKIQIMIIFMGS